MTMLIVGAGDSQLREVIHSEGSSSNLARTASASRAARAAGISTAKWIPSPASRSSYQSTAASNSSAASGWDSTFIVREVAGCAQKPVLLEWSEPRSAG